MIRLSLTVLALAFGTSAIADTLPTRVGECVTTTVKQVETRLVDGNTNIPVPGSGSAVEFANGGYQVSYDQVQAVDRSRPGDPAKMCLVFVPKRDKDCAPGDDRGVIYKTTNLRTHESWTLPNSEHPCGGA